MALFVFFFRRFEEELELEVVPDAVSGVTLTAGELREGLRGALLFGGATESGKHLNDSWFYRGEPGVWIKLKCKGKIPAQRHNHAAGFCSKTRAFFISGGSGGDSKPLQGVYQLQAGEASCCKLFSAQQH